MADFTIPAYANDDLTAPEVQNSVEQAQPSTNVIQNDQFYPNIELSLLRHTMRIDSNITNERLKEAAIHAMLDVNAELVAFRKEKLNDGFSTLADMPSPMINKINHETHHYLRAVYCLTVATLYERYASYDLTNDGEKRMTILEESIDDLRRDARFSIRDILGKPKITAKLL